jgi:atypical dual specificity phosphatase
LYATEAGRPANFGWLDEGRLAGSARPRGQADLLALRERGVRAVVSLTEAPLPADLLASIDLAAVHLPVPDFTAPTPEQVEAATAAIERFLAEGRPVVVHCGAGIGRTGTILACWLVHQGHDADAAVAAVRAARPGSIETPEQRDAIVAYARRLAGAGGDAAGRPPLVIVGGAAGVGKTTLARRLAATLRLPFLSKDLVKEGLYDALGQPDLAFSRRLGAASFVVLQRVTLQLLEAGVGAVVEANYQQRYAEPELRPLIARARAAIVLCDVAPELALRRARERVERGDRHPYHHDDFVLGTPVAANLDHAAHDLDLGLPRLRVDTTTGYQPGFEEIVAFLREQVA